MYKYKQNLFNNIQNIVIYFILFFIKLKSLIFILIYIYFILKQYF